MAEAPPTLPGPAEAPPTLPGPAPGAHPLRRWLPLLAAVAWFVAVLVAADTPVLDIARYAGYVGLAVILPGMLVYRALRRTPHTLVEDVAMGAAVGLALELPAWGVFAALGRQEWLWVWPLAVIVPFVAVPGLHRHWWVRGYTVTPVGWSWTVAGAVAFFTSYLSATFLARNPILPTSDGTRQYLDLAYQLSLAGEAKHQFPIHLPQVAGEPLKYHWFGYLHMAATSLIGRIDLPVVALRLTIPTLCAAAIVLTAVVGWRVSGRPYVGAGAALLFFVIGEVNFTHPVTMPFGTQASFVIWHGMSMIYSWVLLIALIAVLADVIDRRPDGRPDRPVAPLGRGAWALAALLLFASSGAKASSLPVTALALAFTAAVLLIARRRLPWAVIAAGLLTGVAQLFATAVLYGFQTYGVKIGPLFGLARYWALPPDAQPPGRPGWQQWLLVVAVWAAFLINMQLRVAGSVPLLWLRRGRLQPVQWFLLGGALAGPVLYLLLEQPGDGNQYFTRAGFTFGVIASAWGYAMVLDRVRLSRQGRVALAVGAGALAVILVATQWLAAGPAPTGQPYRPLLPLLTWSAVLAAIGLVVALWWPSLADSRPWLRGRGGLVALTVLLVVGAPGLPMDMRKSWEAPNGGAYATVPMPRSRVETARWVRDHSDPHDVVATNAHCLQVINGWCDARSFWLSAYAERRVLVEGWGFAPRIATTGAFTPFWDQELLSRNDEAFTAPTAADLAELRERYAVRWLVVDRSVGGESPQLAGLAARRFDNGRLAVYELR
jgi:hypothetical protein